VKVNVLCLDGGGTRTLAALYGPQGQVLREAEGGPCNPVAYGVAQSSASLIAAGRAALGTEQAQVAAVAVAGALNPAHRIALGQALCRSFGLERALVTTDLHALLWANAPEKEAVLAIAGTGASVLARDRHGRMVRAGGRGTVFGDDGSAYAVAISALRAAAKSIDQESLQTLLVPALTEAAGCSDFEDLAAWSASASKQEIADLARTVIECAVDGDVIAQCVVEDQAHDLASLVGSTFGRLRLPEGTPIFIHGGMFERVAMYRQRFLECLEGWPIQFPAIRGHAAAYALLAAGDLGGEAQVRGSQAKPGSAVEDWLSVVEHSSLNAGLSPTEQADEAAPLDALETRQMVARMCAAEHEVAQAVHFAAPALSEAVELAAEALRSGGRILYTGSGTSGRLGVLDASECPPTFGVAPERVVGLIAGGEAALRNSVEGAEDDEAAGVADLRRLRPNAQDFVVGIAASGTTPYTLGALAAAREAGAATALLCCNPAATAPVDLLIVLDTGPEVLAGSTRLKAGSATKAALNIISTGAMARSGYVYQGLMVGMQPRNAKLRQRARRIVEALTDLGAEQAQELLEQSAWNIRVAVVMAWRKCGVAEAEAALQTAGNDLHRLCRQ
jgi:N-acetylmuramic acid 6-phosphate etherase